MVYFLRFTKERKKRLLKLPIRFSKIQHLQVDIRKAFLRQNCVHEGRVEFYRLGDTDASFNEFLLWWRVPTLLSLPIRCYTKAREHKKYVSPRAQPEGRGLEELAPCDVSPQAELLIYRHTSSAG